MNSKVISPGGTIGILGGGQLGRMMALSAREMGYRIAVLDPTEDCPCAQVADIHIQAAYDDIEAAKELAEVSDVITYEFENVDLKVAKYLEENAYLPQGAELLRISQHRGNEKAAIKKSGVPVVPYRLVGTKEELIEAVKEIGYPAVVKTCQGGYDGKGQLKLASLEDLNEALAFVEQNKDCILEKWLAFDREISVILSRKQNGDYQVFPIPENRHKDHILNQSIVPANISSKVEENAKQAAIKIANSIGLVGTFAVEMFVVGEEVFINEMAPRPHNSGHYTMNACNVSQFGQHIRAICNLPLMKVECPFAAVMINLIGSQMEEFTKNIHTVHNVFLHIYGKKEIKEKRKMGHITLIGENLATINDNLQDITL